MQFGVTMFPTDFSIGVVELARALEERGFESMWVPEHTHIPASRESPWPGGAELPPEYSHSLDPFVALTAAAAVTTRLRVGTGVCLVIERDPITLAKEVASLDYVSGGRFLFGIGGGWNREEMRDHGTDPSRRWRVLRERIAAMKQIWMEDEASFHGEFVDFDRIWSWPKPVQKPHPPVMMGGDGPHTFQRVVAYADEWMPIVARGAMVIADRMAELNRMAVEKGRGPIPVTAWGVRSRPEEIEQYEKAGIRRCIFALPSVPAGQVWPLLDRYTGAMEKFAG